MYVIKLIWNLILFIGMLMGLFLALATGNVFIIITYSVLISIMCANSRQSRELRELRAELELSRKKDK